MSGDVSGKTKILSENSQQPFVLRSVSLTVVKGTNAGRVVEIQKPSISLGKLPGNDLVLSDPAISRNHAVVELQPKGYAIRDLGSTNGTFVDGVRVSEAYLAPGSVIRLGDTEIVFSPREERFEDLRSSADKFGGLYGRSPAMREVYAILERVAPTDVTVLLEGETGTGKELAARGLHENSRRASGPFTVFDCGAVAPNLIESALFGHEKGAFTDAVKTHQGAFELAEGGTIFLDEIGELNLDVQPKLLRALDRLEVMRVGGDRTMSVNVRVIAATNRDLEREVKAGRFREDLFYRLSVVRVLLPPLRRRREDIPLIADRLLKGISSEIGKKITGLSPEAAAALASYAWPGNVRELRNVLGRAAALSDGSRIEARDLFLTQRKKTTTIHGLSGRTLNEIEKAAIQATLRFLNGNKTEAAKALGIAYSTLYEKMKKYGLKV